MSKVKILGTLLLVASFGGLTLVAAGPISAMPGWSHHAHAAHATGMTEAQRDHIRNLHSAYRAALSELDWSANESGHAPETMQKARELRMALRAEILDVLHRGGKVSESSQKGACPYTGRTRPVKFEDEAPTLYL